MLVVLLDMLQISLVSLLSILLNSFDVGFGEHGGIVGISDSGFQHCVENF